MNRIGRASWWQRRWLTRAWSSLYSWSEQFLRPVRGVRWKLSRLSQLLHNDQSWFRWVMCDGHSQAGTPSDDNHNRLLHRLYMHFHSEEHAGADIDLAEQRAFRWLERRSLLVQNHLSLGWHKDRVHQSRYRLYHRVHANDFELREIDWSNLRSEVSVSLVKGENS